jgi:hypothetical protein
MRLALFTDEQVEAMVRVTETSHGGYHLVFADQEQKIKAIIDQALKDRELTEVVSEPLRYESGKLICSQTPSQRVSEAARLIQTRTPEFDGRTFMDDLAKDVVIQARARELAQPALAHEKQESFKDVTVDIQPLSIAEVEALGKHQETHNQNVDGCIFCQKEQAVNQGAE